MQQPSNLSLESSCSVNEDPRFESRSGCTFFTHRDNWLYFTFNSLLSPESTCPVMKGPRFKSSLGFTLFSSYDIKLFLHLFLPFVDAFAFIYKFHSLSLMLTNKREVCVPCNTNTLCLSLSLLMFWFRQNGETYLLLYVCV